ncbi:MAG: Rid family detoxifying hydrolase [Kiritimatiellia bacterium]|nr:Rid family detoxifying hydrolase [Lentisphaerota bacterium]
MQVTKKVVRSAQAPQPVARYSQGIRVGNTLYVQGMVALDPATGKMVAGGVREQAQRVFASIKAVLSAEQMDLRNVVRVAAFLADMADYPVFNEVYNSHFTDDPPPVRTTVQAGLPLGARVEVEVTAVAEM